MLRPSTIVLSLCLFVILRSSCNCAHVENGGLYQDDGIPPSVSVDRLVVHKGAGIMEAWSGGALVRAYPVSVGRGGSGPKRYEGDERTPEGIYRIDSRHPSRRFGYFLHVSYPNERDREAYRQGQRDGTVPPGVGIGGAIGIHGESTGWGWLPHTLFGTAGCIMVDNDSARELYDRVVDDALIEIWP